MWYRPVLVLVVALIFNSVAHKYRQCDYDDDDVDDTYECPTGEYLNECAPEYCDGEYCRLSENDPKPEDCPEVDPDYCEARCMCTGNLVRNDTGHCIRPTDCPPFECSEENEEYDPCPRSCPGETCKDAVMHPARCSIRPRIYVPCKPACRCIKDHFRNEDGRCVPFDECPTPSCPSGEFLNKCPSENCPGDYCPNSPTALQSCPPRKECGIPQCTCNFNTKRNRLFGGCIPTSKCPPFKCPGLNEQYQACPPAYTGESCKDYLNNATIPRFRIGIVVPCKPKCRCKTGYYRNEKNICIPAKECKPPGCNGDPNAQPGCGMPCGRTCKLYNKRPVPCPAICKLNACDCKPGYVLNEDTGKCVLPTQCPKPKCTKPNEIYSSCFDPCPPQTCKALTTGVMCTADVRPCQSGCRCKPGYYRNVNGDCVPAKNCYKCKGAHEYYACGGACDNVCATLTKQNQTNCPIRNIKCNDKCYCEKGYARNKKGVCVPFDQCEQVATGCNHDPNAQPGCGVPCGRTCKLYDKGPVPCPKICKLNACDCKPGYVLNEDTGKCILPSQCPKHKCTGAHEYYACGGACDNVCATLSEQNQTNCPIVNIKCNEMCYCDKGYARDKNGVCVPFDQCQPVATGCNHDPNAQPGCGMPCGRTCKLYDKGPVPCPRICKLNACDCKPGYVLNEDTRKCVLPTQCPKPKCTKPNEIYSSCFDPCPPQTCKALTTGVMCTAVVRPCQSGCRCKPGYYRNVNGDCVPAEDCYKCTGAHELYACGGACDNVCATLSEQNQTNCPIVNIKCNEMCYCENGYARNKKGVCVPFDQCEPVRCPGAHEFFDCGVACDNVCATLSERNRTNCPIINKKCNEMCYCEDGYARNKDNKCVPYDQCESEHFNPIKHTQH